MEIRGGGKTERGHRFTFARPRKQKKKNMPTLSVVLEIARKEEKKKDTSILEGVRKEGPIWGAETMRMQRILREERNELYTNAMALRGEQIKGIPSPRWGFISVRREERGSKSLARFVPL